MLRRSISFSVAILFLATAVYSQTTEPSPKPVEKSKYDLLVEKAKQKDPSVNFTELRVAFYESPNYHPLTPMMTYRPLNAALAQRNYEEALKIAESVLEKNFVEVNAHMVAQIAYQETGNAERAELHKFMADGLLSSIKSSGDGKSTVTAFQVISINEEYGLLRSLGLRPIKQALLQDKGHSYDALTVIDPQTNQQSIVYFNVDRPFAWESRKK
ncbi:MAG TPA: DUF4919 domain-containing protein [Pyrinomonadaceae bacterium]